MVALISDRRLLLLAPLFAASNFLFAFVFSSLNGRLFTARTAGLNAALFWAVEMVASARIGARAAPLPNRGSRPSAAAQAAYWTARSSVRPRGGPRLPSSASPCAPIARRRGGSPGQPPTRPGRYGNLLWLYARSVLLGPTIDQGTGHYVGGILDYTGTDWVPLAALICAFGVIEPIQTTTSFWMLGAWQHCCSLRGGAHSPLGSGQLSQDPTVLGRFAGIAKFVQSLGAAAAWWLGAAPPMQQLWTNVLLLNMTLPGALLVARHCLPAPSRKPEL